MSDKTKTDFNKINEDGIEYSPLLFFLKSLHNCQDKDQEDKFFYEFVKFIRHGNTIQVSIELARNEVDYEE